MVRWNSLRFLFALFCVYGFHPLLGHDDQATKLFESGMALYKQADFPAAMDHFSRALLFRPHDRRIQNYVIETRRKIIDQEIKEKQRPVARLPHFSVFALIGQSGTSLTDAYAFPVPFQPSLGHRSITFTNLAQEATIRIFTVSGKLVQTLRETDGNGQLVWDVKNAEGSKVASGVYFYLMESTTDKKTGKLTIIR